MRLRLFRNDNIASIFVSTALTMMLAELTGVITILIDGVITSRFLGTDVYSGISALKPFTSIVLVAAGFLSTGCNIITSQLIGKGMKREANDAFNTTVYLSLIISALIFAACMLFPTAIMRICGVDLQKYPELNQYLYQYLRGYVIGVPALIAVSIFGPVMVMDNGKKAFTMSSMVLCAVDIIGDLLNAFVFHGGAFGMGLATSVSYFAQIAVMLPLLLRSKGYFFLSLKAMRPGILVEVFRHGTPAFTKKTAGMLRDILTNYVTFLTAVSYAAIAARGIQTDLFQFFFCIPTGLGRALITMVGIYYSAEDLKGLERLYSFAIRIGLIMSAGFACVIMLAAGPLVRIYADDPQILSLAAFSVRWMAAALVFDMIAAILQYYLQGIGDLKRANLLSFGERFIAPASAALILGYLYGQKGVLASAAVGKIILVVGVFLISTIRLKRLPRTWRDIMFLPKDFGGSESDNMYVRINDYSDVSPVSEKTNEFCLEHGIDPKQAALMSLFAEELCANVFEHAARKNRPAVTIDYRLYITDKRICFSMMDLGDHFDPSAFYELHRNDSPEENIGIRAVMNAASDVRYFSTFSSNNLVVSLDRHV